MKKIFSSLISVVFMLVAFSSGASTFIGDRTDFRDETIYFVMTTRFYDGDPSNNWQCWDNTVSNYGDPAWRGDFKGLIEKLDYIKALGFTAVWITPVVTNASGYDYHGYHAFDFSTVDKRLESEDVDFQDLIDAVHARGMKIILDIVLNHSGNFGEANLCKMFTRDWTKNQATIYDCMIPHMEKDGGKLPDDYLNMLPGQQYTARIAQLQNRDGVNHDVNNYWHHAVSSFIWDHYSRWYGTIAGDCIDLNTENPYVSNYLVKCYGKFIEMGVDGFRIDSSGHMSRLTFNKAFLPQFLALAEQHKDKRNGGDFFMFGEVTSRYLDAVYKNHENLSPFFYTWKETNDYPWDYSETSWNGIEVMHGQKGNHVNITSQDQQGEDYNGISNLPNSNNAFLDGNTYHTPDHSMYSGMSVIDFPMHWNFRTAEQAYSIKSYDNLYNDATYNVVYVDSHDYAPDGAPDTQRFNQPQAVWAENLSLMFTFRGIPCVYYGSEIEFRKGYVIDGGTDIALKESGRAYFGGYIKGEVKATDFAEYIASGNVAETLQHPLAKHIQRLNQIRAAIPALRKGQYSTQGCTGKFAFKRRYTDDKVDSYALVTISGNAKFSGIENGTYIDAVTGDLKNVTQGRLTVECGGIGNLRVYVLCNDKSGISGKIGIDGPYIRPDSNTGGYYQPEYDGTEEEASPNNGGPNDEVAPNPNPDPDEPIDPWMDKGEQGAFFESKWEGKIYAYVWTANGRESVGWPGDPCQSLGNGIWKWHYNGTNNLEEMGAYIIFNNGSSQTSDLTFVNGGYYNNLGQLVKVIEPETPTGVSAVSANGLSITTQNGVLYITSPVARSINIVSATGVMMRRNLQAGKNAIAGLPRGVYVIAGKKVVL